MTLRSLSGVLSPACPRRRLLAPAPAASPLSPKAAPPSRRHARRSRCASRAGPGLGPRLQVQEEERRRRDLLRESIGRAKKKGGLPVQAEVLRLPSSGSTRPAPTTGRRTASLRERHQRLPPGRPDRQVQGRVAPTGCAPSTSAARAGSTATGATGRSTRRSCRSAAGSSTTPREFETVEVNSTFYRLAKPEAVARWVAETPRGVRLDGQGEPLHDPRAAPAGPRRAARALLRGDRAAGRVAASSARCCGSCRRTSSATRTGSPTRWSASRRGRHCFEFRHESWFTEDVLSILRAYGAALVYGDHPERPWQPLELTTDWTFVRFHYGRRGRRGNYSETELREWAAAAARRAPRGRGVRLLQQRLGGVRAPQRAAAADPGRGP